MPFKKYLKTFFHIPLNPFDLLLAFSFWSLSSMFMVLFIFLSFFFFTFITHVCSISNLEHHFMCNWMFHNGTVTGLLNNLCSVRCKDESISFFFIHFLCYISPVLNYLLERYQNFPFISVFKILFKILISLYLKILILKFIWYFKV